MKKPYCNICKEHVDHDDIYDCQEHYEVENGIRKGQWMIDWMVRKNKMTKLKTDSRFVKWSVQFFTWITSFCNLCGSRA